MAASKGSASPRTWATRYLVYSVSSRAVLPGHRHQSSRLKCSVNTGCGTISIFGIVRSYLNVVLETLTRFPSQLAGSSEEHTYQLQSRIRSSYAVFCLKQR